MNTPDKSRIILEITPLMRMFNNDKSVVIEVLQDFIEPTNRNISDLLDAVDSRSLENIEMLSHKLKSSSKSVGAIELGCICEDIESAAKNNNLESIDNLATQLEPLMKEVINKINSL